MKALNLSGQTFGWLTAICPYDKVGNIKRWKCVCKCGKVVYRLQNHLYNRRTKHHQSCGCWWKVPKGAPAAFHTQWLKVKNDSTFEYIGAFYEVYKAGYTKERKYVEKIDDNQPYSATNIKFVSIKEMGCIGRLTRNAKTYTYNGKTLTVKQWADRLGISRQRVVQRLERYSVEDALSGKNHLNVYIDNLKNTKEARRQEKIAQKKIREKAGLITRPHPTNVYLWKYWVKTGTTFRSMEEFIQVVQPRDFNVWRLKRIDKRRPLGRDNFEWVKRYSSV